MSLDQLKVGITALVLIALIAAAGAIALDNFQDDLDASVACTNETAYYNTTSDQCEVSATNATALGEMSETYNATNEGLEGTANATSYLSTIGTLLGVAALVAIVIGAFYFIRK